MKTLSNSIVMLRLIGIMAFAGIGCGYNESDTFPSGTYTYKGYDLEGKLVTEGRIHVLVADSMIEGTRNIVEVNVGGAYFLEAGSGIIDGQIAEDQTISITLMESEGPYMIIRGEYNDGLLTGERYWGISGGAPETVIGTFISRRLK